MKKNLIAAMAGSTVLAAGVGAGTATASSPAPAAGTRPPSRTWTPTAPSSVSTGVAVLPNGDRVGVQRNPGAAPTVTAPADLARAGARSMTIGTTTYVIPRRMSGVAGRVFDKALFDVGTLAARGSGRTAVNVTYASSSAPTAVPGIVITARTGTTATGYVDAASSAALGRALATTDAKTLFAHVRTVAPPAQPAATPRWPMVTVTIRLIGLDGRPLDDLVGFTNVVDPGKGNGMVFTTHGIAKISVPAGTYQLLGSTFTEVAGKPVVAMGAGRETTVGDGDEIVLDLRKATMRLKTSVNKPVVNPFWAQSVNREIQGPTGGVGFSLSALGDDSFSVRVVPTVGTLHGIQSLTKDYLAVSPSGVTPAYRFATHYSIDGRIPDGTIVKHSDASNLMTYKDRFTGVRSLASASFARAVTGHGGGWSLGAPLPGDRLTTYATAGPGLDHSARLDQYISFDPTFTTKGSFASPPAASPKPGTIKSVVWGVDPLHQRYAAPPASAPFKICPACVGDGVFNVEAPPLSTNAQLGSADLVEPDILGRVTIKADDTVLYAGQGQLSGYSALPAGTKSVTTTQVATRSGAVFPRTTVLSTKSSTKMAASFPAPDGWMCLAETGCRVLPFLSVDYRIAGQTALGALPAGKRRLDLTVNQVGRATAKGVTSVKVWVSYDGKTWTAAPVTGSGAQRAVALTIPEPGSGRTGVNLKVSVADAAGSTYTEQITGAFGLAG